MSSFRRRQRNRRYRTNYGGLTVRAYNRMLYAQNERCAICLHVVKRDNGDVLDVDHDHSTGEVRGLLCRNCNVGLGHFKDDPKLLHTAELYLLRCREKVKKHS